MGRLHGLGDTVIGFIIYFIISKSRTHAEDGPSPVRLYSTKLASVILYGVVDDAIMSLLLVALTS